MQVYHQLEQIPDSLTQTAVAIGNFDGLHLGHRALLESLLNESKKTGLSPSILTFYPHPVEVLKPELQLQSLTTTDEKIELLGQMGIENILIARFDQNLISLTPDQFVKKYLIEGLRAKQVHVGFNFCFGKNRSGNTDVLKSLLEKAGSELQVEKAFTLSGERVSSSVVRNSVQSGDMRKARTFLGRPYTLSGIVIAGDGRGRTIGIPTANLLFAKEKCLPKAGVYATVAKWQEQVYQAVTNVGVRPTFKAHEPVTTVETHILDFNEKIYDQHLEVAFLDRLRDEKRFDSMQALVEQIRADIESRRRYSSK